MRAVAVALLLLVGCTDDDPAQRARTVCTAFCDCSQIGGFVDVCIDNCTAKIAAVTDECLQCVYANSQTCSALDSDCSSLCSSGSAP